MDLVANQIIFGCLLNAGSVCTGSSEENPTEDEISPTGMYSTVFTPLTGAAVLDTNAAAGSIWGTYDSRKIVGCKGRDLKVAAMATYGMRTRFICISKYFVYNFFLSNLKNHKYMGNNRNHLFLSLVQQFELDPYLNNH